MNKYLTGQCSEEEIIEVNAWMKESEENARQLFRMEEIYHLGKFDRYADEQSCYTKSWTKQKGNRPNYCVCIVG